MDEISFTLKGTIYKISTLLRINPNNIKSSGRLQTIYLNSLEIIFPQYSTLTIKSYRNYKMPETACITIGEEENEELKCGDLYFDDNSIDPKFLIFANVDKNIFSTAINTFEKRPNDISAEIDLQTTNYNYDNSQTMLSGHVDLIWDTEKYDKLIVKQIRFVSTIFKV